MPFNAKNIKIQLLSKYSVCTLQLVSYVHVTVATMLVSHTLIFTTSTYDSSYYVSLSYFDIYN